MMTTWLTALFLAFGLSSVALSTPQQAYAEMEKGQAIIVDVREKKEVVTGMIAKAHWFPLSRIKSGHAWEKEFKILSQGKKVYLYCQSGRRAENATQILKEQGINAHNIGGYRDLKDILPISNEDTGRLGDDD